MYLRLTQGMVKSLGNGTALMLSGIITVWRCDFRGKLAREENLLEQTSREQERYLRIYLFIYLPQEPDTVINCLWLH